VLLNIKPLSFQWGVFSQLGPSRRHGKKGGAETNALKL
jgi:hypothetical protein